MLKAKPDCAASEKYDDSSGERPQPSLGCEPNTRSDRVFDRKLGVNS